MLVVNVSIIYIYLFHTLGTAKTSTFEEKQKKNIYMWPCTHQITGNVKICTLMAVHESKINQLTYTSQQSSVEHQCLCCDSCKEQQIPFRDNI